MFIFDINLRYKMILRRATIKSIGRIRKYLSKEDLKRLVNALVISRLDYANSILYGLPKYELDKLQRVQNAAARLITGKKKSDHITPVLKELHWLPIKYRINFKIILLVYKSLDNLAPDYLHKIIEERCPTRILLSSRCSLLSTPKIYTTTYGKRAFLMLPRNFGTLYQNILNPLSLF